MRHTLIVSALTALSLIAAKISFSPRASGAVNGSSPKPLTRSAAQSASPTAPAAAPFQVATELDKAIFHIFQDSKGTYWFGSHGQGLYRHDGDALARFTTDSGLCSDDIGGIQEDQSGNLYVSTSKGICKFDGRNFTTLKVEDFDASSTERKPGPDALWFMFGGEKPHAIYYDGKAHRVFHLQRPPGWPVARHARARRVQIQRKGV